MAKIFIDKKRTEKYTGNAMVTSLKSKSIVKAIHNHFREEIPLNIIVDILDYVLYYTKDHLIRGYSVNINGICAIRLKSSRRKIFGKNVISFRIKATKSSKLFE